MTSRFHHGLSDFAVGTKVTVLKAITYPDYQLPPGFSGIVVSVDEDGDALVKFGEHNSRTAWLLKRDIESVVIDVIFAGCRIVSDEPISTLSDPPLTIDNGVDGYVISIDEDGDALIDFRMPGGQVWVSRSDFRKLRVKTVVLNFQGDDEGRHSDDEDDEVQQSNKSTGRGTHHVHYHFWNGSDDELEYYQEQEHLYDYDTYYEDHDDQDGADRRACSDHQDHHPTFSSDGGSIIGSDFSVPSDCDAFSAGSFGSD